MEANAPSLLIRHTALPAWIYCRRSLRFLDVNDQAVRAYGWSRVDFLHMTIADIRPPEEVPALMTSVSHLRDRPAGCTGPWRHRRADGSSRRVRVSFDTVRFKGGPARLVVAEPDDAGLRQLSPRERAVFTLVAHGETSLAIAGRLGLSPKSVETYRARFMRKLELATLADVIEYALGHGLLV